MDIAVYVFFAIFGLIIGSFLNVVILRLPYGEKLTGRSHCPVCSHILTSSELVPVFSYVLQRGKCRHCHTKISPRYCSIELITGLLFAGVYAFSMPAVTLDWLMVIRLLIIVALAVVIFVIDYEHFLILDSVLVTGASLLFLITIAYDIMAKAPFIKTESVQGLIGAISVFIVFYSIWYFSKGKWVGFGDVKFVPLIGFTLGPQLVWLAIILACVIGTLVALPLLALGLKRMSSKIPFGTFLAIAWIITVLYGNNLLDWYIGLITI